MQEHLDYIFNLSTTKKDSTTTTPASTTEQTADSQPEPITIANSDKLHMLGELLNTDHLISLFWRSQGTMVVYCP